MVISSWQMFGFLSGIVTLVGSITATALPDWKHNNYADDSFGGGTVLRGLWAVCTAQQNGAMSCRPISDPFFVLSIVLRGCRTLAVLSCILSFIGVATTPLGMQCTRIGGDQLTKSRLARFGALLFGTAGILIGASVSWFADDIANDFTKPPKPNIFIVQAETKYVYGSSLFIGWASMVAGVISSVFLVLGSMDTAPRPRNRSNVITPSTDSRYPSSLNRNDGKCGTPTKGQPGMKPFKSFASVANNNGSQSGYAATALISPQRREQTGTHSSTVKSSNKGDTGNQPMKTYV